MQGASPHVNTHIITLTHPYLGVSCESLTHQPSPPGHSATESCATWPERRDTTPMVAGLHTVCVPDPNAGLGFRLPKRRHAALNRRGHHPQEQGPPAMRGARTAPGSVRPSALATLAMGMQAPPPAKGTRLQPNTGAGEVPAQPSQPPRQGNPN
jgi:hypothetical protein